jgi:sarcosine oxidase, subunit gamma
MMALEFQRRRSRHRFGLKGPRAADWLTTQGIPVPAAPNTWIGMDTAGVAVGNEPGAAAGEAAAGDAPGDTLLVARLGTGEFFLEDRAGGSRLWGIEPAPEAHPPGVYPVLRGDAAFLLSGRGSLDVLAQVCNVNFGELALDSRPVVMTLMIGVAVLIVPQGADAGRRFRIWCDPTFGAYLEESMGTVVIDSGGNYRGESA